MRSNATGRVTVKDLATRLAISTETVRRDLRDLELRGHARRVYGGAVLDRRESDRPFDERVRVGAREKARIAEAALPLVEDGMTVFIDAGTTTLAFARKLLGRRIRVHTNSIDIAALLAGDPQAQVTVLGGDMKPDYRALFGHRTLAVLREHIYDVAIMGIVTVHHAHGFMDLGEDEAVLRRFAVGAHAPLRHPGRFLQVRPGSAPSAPSASTPSTPSSPTPLSRAISRGPFSAHKWM